MKLDNRSFEYQVGILMVTAAGADSEITQEEIGAMAESLNELFALLEQDTNSYMFIDKLFEDITSISESEMGKRIEFAILELGKQMTKDQLKIILDNLVAVAGADGLNDQETEFLSAVQNSWFPPAK